MSDLTTDAVTQLNAYHDLSKHRFGGYAPGPETLDWDDQPSVFRHFDAAPRIELPQRADVTLGSGLRLVHLKTCNTRKAAAQLCCNQMIAAASACTLLMLAEFEDTLAQQVTAGYQQLYYEAGVLGQALYLSATALGLNGTGIGCFFDDAVHELLGIEGHALQTLYGFALGEGKPDTRVTALSGYHHLREPHHV